MYQTYLGVDISVLIRLVYVRTSLYLSSWPRYKHFLVCLSSWSGIIISVCIKQIHVCWLCHSADYLQIFLVVYRADLVFCFVFFLVVSTRLSQIWFLSQSSAKIHSGCPTADPHTSSHLTTFSGGFVPDSNSFGLEWLVNDIGTIRSPSAFQTHARLTGI